jgi:hypothetical protein
MGITANTIEMLLMARRSGVDFSELALIGRQQFLYLDFATYKAVVARCGLAGSDLDLADDQMVRHTTFADQWLRRIGSERITSYDASAFEGATCVHDFNLPIPQEHWGRFSTLYDGGSLEHLFNVPVALANCMRMIRIGGHYVAAVPCNQWAGHGFYQFSPELFYGVFSEENGFRDTRVCIYHELGDSEAAVFPNPRQLGRRLEFQSRRATSLFVTSRKCAEVEPLARFPQQSDYAAAWQSNT